MKIFFKANEVQPEIKAEPVYKLSGFNVDA